MLCCPCTPHWRHCWRGGGGGIAALSEICSASVGSCCCRIYVLHSPVGLADRRTECIGRVQTRASVVEQALMRGSSGDLTSLLAAFVSLSLYSSCTSLYSLLCIPFPVSFTVRSRAITLCPRCSTPAVPDVINGLGITWASVQTAGLG